MGKETERLRNLYNLSHVKRWSIVPTTRTEHVAEHSFRVAVLSDFMADRLEGVRLDRLWLIRSALTHDLDECFTGDIPSPAKRILQRKDDVLAMIEKEMIPTDDITPDDKGRECFIVKIADLLDALWSVRMYGLAPYSVHVTNRLEEAIYKKAEGGPIYGLDNFDEVLEEVHKAILSPESLVPPWMKPGAF